MKCFRCFNLLIVGFVFSTVAIGCGSTKQVLYTSGPPNVAVSAKGLYQPSETQPTQVTYSNETQYVQVNQTGQ